MLEFKNGKLLELDQAQTRFGLSETTVFCGDALTGVAVQATRSWINVLSAQGNVVYRIGNSERLVACSSRSGSNRIVVGLGEGELRGKGRVLVLEVGGDGQIIEKGRKDIVTEILDLVLVGDHIVVATTDNSLLLLSSFSITHHLSLNSQIKSLTSANNGDILVSSTTGVLTRLRIASDQLVVESSRLLSSEPLSLSKTVVLEDGTNGVMGFTQSQSFFISSDLRIDRLDFRRGTSSACPVGSRLIGINSGELDDYAFTPVRPATVMDTFCLKTMCQVDSPVKSVISYNTKLVVLFDDSEPLVVDSVTHEALRLYSLGIVKAAVTVTLNAQQYLLTWSESSGLSLLDEYLVWSKPMTDPLDSIAQLSPELVVCVTSDGRVMVFSLSVSEVPRLVGSAQAPFQGGHNSVFTIDGRIILVNSLCGVTTCIFRDSVIFTSISSNAIDQIASCAVLARNLVVCGTARGTIYVYKIPDSVSTDELTQCQGLPTGLPADLCMTATEIIVAVQVSESPIVSLVHCGDKRNVVYFSAAGGELGAIFPLHPTLAASAPVQSGVVLIDLVTDDLVRHRLKGNYSWAL